ncbi:hypothetical protein BCR43DRAFT_37005 [Syncephalastrum racemosum]|uniref:Uncharacterized protein n=1 Tax=Syncephalastrum racemosum TaxID=13706 RepID=A0A1X2HU56_SYNRA|nr:hypothetical protein BCR43DRAFT_37005 [Syncephalastrum racemosum]
MMLHREIWAWQNNIYVRCPFVLSFLATLFYFIKLFWESFSITFFHSKPFYSTLFHSVLPQLGVDHFAET